MSHIVFSYVKRNKKFEEEEDIQYEALSGIVNILSHAMHCLVANGPATDGAPQSRPECRAVDSWAKGSAVEAGLNAAP